LERLITWKDADGRTGRCDARCWGYDNNPYKDCNCHCICNGANHAAGMHTAIANTKAFVHGWIEQRGNIVEWNVAKTVKRNKNKQYGNS